MGDALENNSSKNIAEKHLRKSSIFRNVTDFKNFFKGFPAFQENGSL